MNHKKRVLVTGANGFIGRRLCQKLQEEGSIVRAFLRREISGPWDEVVLGDLTAPSLPQGMMTGIDGLYHLAGKAHALAETVKEESQYETVNVAGTKALLKEAQNAKVGFFIFFSSVKSMGDGGDEVLTESCQIPPQTPYGISKLAAEKLVFSAEKIPHRVILRPTMVYGPDNPGNLEKMILAIKGGYFPPFPNITNHRSMLHVDDLVQAAILAANQKRAHNQIYIVSDGEGYSTRQLYIWMCAALQKQLPIWSVPLPILKLLAIVGDGIGFVQKKRFMFNSDALAKLTDSAIYSSEKIKKELGFKPKWNLKMALPLIVKSCIK
ncbi:MAG: NAD-dependent epimerase/dehydratase family protein [Magnetococcales bacterium]|nr:NAD-dependent epimerase/dehydratase family protein [Magnetococcales bacterium]